MDELIKKTVFIISNPIFPGACASTSERWATSLFRYLNIIININPLIICGIIIILMNIDQKVLREIWRKSQTPASPGRSHQTGGFLHQLPWWWWWPWRWLWWYREADDDHGSDSDDNDTSLTGPLSSERWFFIPKSNIFPLTNLVSDQWFFYCQTIIKYIFPIWSISSSEHFFHQQSIPHPDRSCSKENIESKISICVQLIIFSQQEDQTLLHLLRLMQWV